MKKRTHLTKYEEKTLETLRAFRAERDISPTLRELASVSGLPLGTVQACVKKLEDFGKVTHIKGSLRTLRPVEGV
jgi:DNA-binding IclR family transcriptional regulator